MIMRMREKELESAIMLISAFMENKSNWTLSRKKSYLIKIAGMKRPMPGKIVYVNTLGDEILLSLATIKPRFSFRRLHFIPYIMILNVPLSNIEYIQNAIPEIKLKDEKAEEEFEEKDVSYI